MISTRFLCRAGDYQYTDYGISVLLERISFEALNLLCKLFVLAILSLNPSRQVFIDLGNLVDFTDEVSDGIESSVALLVIVITSLPPVPEGLSKSVLLLLLTTSLGCSSYKV